MEQTDPYLAVIADMDGVITRTARVHERAWQHMFDAFLADRDHAPGEDHAPFTAADYRDHLDGKPRLDGVRDFLSARGIVLPEGQADDGPDQDTVHGLGTRKSEQFLATLDRDGVDTFADTLLACDRWQRGGLQLAVISASRNCRPVLARAGVGGRFETIVDGRTAEEEGLSGKLDLIKTAAARLGVPIERTVLLEDALAGLQAGHDAGCGLVVHVDRRADQREGDDDPLTALADTTVQDVAALRFARRLPDVLGRREVVTTLRARRPVAVFLDFDGTLSPIVDDPDAAGISAPMRDAVRELSTRATVAVVSGRDRADVQRRVGIDGLFFAGSHGMDIAGPDHDHVAPAADAAVPAIEAAEARLREGTEGIDGAVVERKRFSVAVHYRRVADDEVARIRDLADQALAANPQLRAHPGKKVIDLVPDIDWNKGHAVRWLLDTLELDPESHLILYLGDDETDEDAFRALADGGLGIHVGPEVTDTLADYRLADQDAVESFLRWLPGD